jgi:hypothetical protein
VNHDNPDSIRRSVPIPSGLKSRLRQWAPARDAWTIVRARQVESEYRRRREHYARVAANRGLVYDIGRVTGEVRARMAARGYTPIVRSRGEIHTFAYVPTYGWHTYLLPDLRELGPLTHFDYQDFAFDFERMASGDVEGRRQRAALMERILPPIREAHARRPIDWIFCYAGGQDLSPAVLQQIAGEIGVPIVNMSLDDKQGWAGRTVGDARCGAVDITRDIDLYMTSSRVACEWHLAEGGRPVYLPEGVDVAAYAPSGVAQDIAVSFIGAAYGFRVSLVEELRKAGIDVQTFGAGWGSGRISSEEQLRIMNRSIINLGMGGIEYSEVLTNVKGRDFEIPGTGGGVYLTTFNADLAQHFVIGQEILCYHSRDEMIELIRWYSARPDEARAIALRARERCVREHRWLHRYEAMLRILGVLPS